MSVSWHLSSDTFTIINYHSGSMFLWYNDIGKQRLYWRLTTNPLKHLSSFEFYVHRINDFLDCLPNKNLLGNLSALVKFHFRYDEKTSYFLSTFAFLDIIMNAFLRNFHAKHRSAFRAVFDWSKRLIIIAFVLLQHFWRLDSLFVINFREETYKVLVWTSNWERWFNKQPSHHLHFMVIQVQNRFEKKGLEIAYGKLITKVPREQISFKNFVW